MDQVPTPSLVRFGSVASLIVGAIAILLAILVSMGFGDTSRLSSSALGSWALPFWCISALLTGVLLVAIGYGMRKRQRWSRRLVVLFWVVNGLLAGIQTLLEARTGQFHFSLLWLGGLAIATWYFYFKGNVVRYYQSLAQEVGDVRSA